MFSYKQTDEQSILLYRWTGPDSSDYSGNVLLLRDLTFSHAGKYVCTATFTTSPSLHLWMLFFKVSIFCHEPYYSVNGILRLE